LPSDEKADFTDILADSEFVISNDFGERTGVDSVGTRAAAGGTGSGWSEMISVLGGDAPSTPCTIGSAVAPFDGGINCNTSGVLPATVVMGYGCVSDDAGTPCASSTEPEVRQRLCGPGSNIDSD
jgi:hypothetical protein